MTYITGNHVLPPNPHPAEVFRGTHKVCCANYPKVLLRATKSHRGWQPLGVGYPTQLIGARWIAPLPGKTPFEALLHAAMPNWALTIVAISRVCNMS